MVVELHQAAALIYLVAGILAATALALSSRQLSRVSVGVLALGAAVHALAFAAFHRVPNPPPLTDLPAAVSLMAFLGVIFFLLLLQRARLTALGG